MVKVGDYIKFIDSFDEGVSSDFRRYEGTVHQVTKLFDKKVVDDMYDYEIDGWWWTAETVDKIVTKEKNPEYFL